MKWLQERRARGQAKRWARDVAVARLFVSQQPLDVAPELRPVVDELILLGETPDPPPERVRALLAQVDELIGGGVDESVYRLAVVDAAVEYLK